MVATSEPISLDPARPRIVRRDMRLRPAGLGFVDRALEREFWAEHVRDRERAIKGNIGLLYAFVIAFAVVDVTVFREHAATMLTVRGLMALLMAPLAWWIYGPRSSEVLQRWGQEFLLYLAAVPVVGLFVMGWVVVGAVDDHHLTLTLIAALFTLLCIYCTSGLRFAYAAPLGIGGTLAYFAMVLARTESSPKLLLIVAAFLFGESLIGLVVSFNLERMARRDFVRRVELKRANERTEALLLNLMPRAFADRLLAGEDALERLPRATVLFATLVGFKEATVDLAPVDAVKLLDRLVARFDRLARGFGVERIKTVGATYMAAAGIPAPRDDDAEAAARLAIAMRDLVREIAAREDRPLSLRVGIATGPVVAGVIGRSRLAFDCWGDTPNVAARLDTHGEADRIHLAAATADALEGRFVIERRGPVAIKGKGTIETAWLGDEA
jgi:class 3 adenylate cyclase